MTTTKDHKQSFGTGALFLSAFLYSLFGVFTRYVLISLRFYYQSASRYFIGTLILFTLVIFFHSYKKVEKSDWKWFVLISFFAVGTNIPFYLAVNNLPLGTAMFLFYAASVVSSYLFGFFSLKEHISLVKVVALFLAILGIGFIYQGNFNLSQPVYLLAAAMAGGFFGLYTSTNKKVNLKYSSLQVTFTSYFIIFLLTTIFMINAKESINLNFSSSSWFFNILYAVSMVISSFCTVYGFKYIEAQKGSLILLSEVVFVVINGFIFFKEIPSIFTIIGGIIILSAMTLPNIDLKQKRLLS